MSTEIADDDLDLGRALAAEFNRLCQQTEASPDACTAAAICIAYSFCRAGSIMDRLALADAFAGSLRDTIFANAEGAAHDLH